MNTNRPEESVTPWHAVVPRTAWIIAVVVAVGMECLLQLVHLNEAQPEMPLWCWILVSTLVPMVVGACIVLYGYIYGDAKRRGMRAVMWVLLAIFIPNLIGVILYFILRDPIQKNCSGCGALVHDRFAFCPKCGSAMRAACVNCSNPLEDGWTNCAHCGSKIGE